TAIGARWPASRAPTSSPRRCHRPLTASNQCLCTAGKRHRSSSAEPADSGNRSAQPAAVSPRQVGGGRLAASPRQVGGGSSVCGSRISRQRWSSETTVRAVYFKLFVTARWFLGY